jgi:phosphotriesterase-related protein
MTTTAASRAGFAQTVLGPVAPASLGLTLPHEHLLIDLRFLFRPPVPGSALGHELAPIELAHLYEINYDWFSNLDNLSLADEATAIDEAGRFRRDGGQTLVDPTSAGIGRNPLALQRVARATGLHVIMGSGYYTEPAHPPEVATATEDALARAIVRDVTDGVGETSVRAGLIGEIGCSWPWTAAERKSLRAAAHAARETGAPLMIHPGRDPKAPEMHLEEVRRTGLDLRRVIVAHIERTIIADPGRLRAVVDTGCTVEYDLFGVEISHFPWGGPDMPNDAERIRQVLWLIEQGYGRQVLLSHDVCFKIRLTGYGGTGLVHIPRRIVPRLRARGASEADIRALIVENPARALTFA